jgi:hypothetical protein
MRLGRGVVIVAACATGCADRDALPPPPPDAGPVTGDFVARCAGPGVIRCFAFDAAAEITDRVLLAGDNQIHASIDPDVARTGAGALRFDLPSESGPNAAGAVWQHTSEDLSVQFGEGDAVFVQWRQRFAPDFLRTFDVTTGARGWHQLGLGEGDRPGGFPTLSCTELEIVVEQAPAAGSPTAHHGCPVESPLPTASIDYRAGEWMTFQLEVSIGTWNTPSSHIRLWAAAEGATQTIVLDAAAFTLDHDPANGTDPAGEYGKLWLEPFITDKDPAEVHPIASTWYDDVIVARQWIGDAVP